MHIVINYFLELFVLSWFRNRKLAWEPPKSWQRCERSLCSAIKPLRQWKEPRSVIYFLPIKLGIEQKNKVPGKIKISYLLVEIFERPLNIAKRPSIENIDIFYNYGPGVRGTNAQRLPSPIWEHSDLFQDFTSTGLNSFGLLRKWLHLRFFMSLR